MKQATELTKQVIYAAGRDAGNRSMRAAGRSRWSREDFRAACAEHDRLMPFLGALPPAEQALIDSVP